MSQDTRELDRVSARLQTLPPSWWLPRPSEVTVDRLASGTYHTSFLATCGDHRWVVRMNRTSQWGLSAAAQLSREYETLRDVAPSGVTPRPVALLDEPLPLLVESYVEGRPFNYSEGLVPAARAAAVLHRQPLRHSAAYLPDVQPAEFLLADGLRWVERAESSGAASSTTRLLRSWAIRLNACQTHDDEPRGIVHTDMIASNLLLTSGGCFVIDWEGARHGPTAWDLAYFLSPVTTSWAEGSPALTKAQQELFLATYAECADLPLDLVHDAVTRILPLVVLRALCWCVGHSVSPGLHPEIRSHLELLTSPEFVEGTLARVSS